MKSNAKKKGQVKRIQGLIALDNWDVETTKRRLALYATNGNGYYIEPTNTGRELVELVHELVMIRGIIKKDKLGSRCIEVINYELLDHNLPRWPWSSSLPPSFL